MRSTRSAKRACISQELVADVKVERFKHSKRSIPAGLAAAQKALVSDATDIGEDSGHIQRPAKKAKALSSKDCVTIVSERERVPTQVAPGPPKGQEQVQAPEPSSTTQLIPTAPSAAPSQQLQQEPFPPLDVDAVQEVQNLLRPGGRRETAACTTLEHCSIPLGREQPYQQLTGIMEACCASGQGACVYVSGLPGTGKSFTMGRVLEDATGRHSACPPSIITLNCMALQESTHVFYRLLQMAYASLDIPVPKDAQATATDPRAAYAALVHLLQKPPKPPTSGVKRKAGRASSTSNSYSTPATGGKHACLILLDEVDRLLNRKDGEQDLLQLFSLSKLNGACVVVAAIANSLDLTERLLPVLKCRGVVPQHVLFTAYNRTQTVAILKAQLASLPWKVFDDTALDLVAKSVTNTSGDLRMALKVCRSALDALVETAQAAHDSGSAPTRPLVGMVQMSAALNRISAAGGGAAGVHAKVKTLPPHQQLVLLGLAQAVGAAAAAHARAKDGINPLAHLNGVSNGVVPCKSPFGVLSNGAPAPVQGEIFTGSRAKFVEGSAFRAMPLSVANSEAVNAAGMGTAAPRAGSSVVLGISRSQPGAAPAPGNVSGSFGRAASAPGPLGAPGNGPQKPSSMLAGDAGLILDMPAVYAHYSALCKQMDIAAVPEMTFKGEICPALSTAALIKVCEDGSGAVKGRGRGVFASGGGSFAGSRMSLQVGVADVRAAMQENVMFKRLLGVAVPASSSSITAAGAAGVVVGK